MKKGSKHSVESLVKISKGKSGSIPWNKGLKGYLACEKNPKWMGDNVSYISLHKYIRKHKPRPELCERCQKVPPRDIASKDGAYIRDINHFLWLCHKCHYRHDEELNLHPRESYSKRWTSA